MKSIKTLLFFSMSLLLVFAASAQDKSNRKSPPAQVSKKIGDVTVTVDFSKPSKRGREVFGKLVKYGEVWRTGANESTWIEFSGDVEVEGKKVSAGKYGLFTVPGESEWVIILNKTWDKWGAFSYKESDDVLRVNVKSQKTEATEVFDIQIDDDGNVSLAWDETMVSFAVK